MDLLNYVIDSYENKEYVETNETMKIEKDILLHNKEVEEKKKEKKKETKSKSKDDVLKIREKYYKELEDNYCKPHNNIIGGN